MTDRISAAYAAIAQRPEAFITVRDEDTVMMEAGTTTAMIARYLTARRGVQIEMVECARAHVEHLQGDGPAIVFCPTGIAEFLQGLQEAIYGWLGQLDFTGKLFKSDGALPGKFFQDTKNPHCRTDKRGSGGF